MSDKETPARILVHCMIFRRWQLYWFTLHYLAGITAIVAGGLATAAAAESGPVFITGNAWLWGLLSAFLSGVVTFLSPLQKARDYKQAFYLLDTAIVRYQSHLSSASELLNQYEQAKHIVLFGEAKVAAEMADED